MMSEPSDGLAERSNGFGGERCYRCVSLDVGSKTPYSPRLKPGESCAECGIAYPDEARMYLDDAEQDVNKEMQLVKVAILVLIAMALAGLLTVGVLYV